MAFFAVILALELWPMITLIGWRRRVARGEQPDSAAAPLLARISYAQAGIVIVMVFLAAAMARGYGVSSPSHQPTRSGGQHGTAELVPSPPGS